MILHALPKGGGGGVRSGELVILVLVFKYPHTDFGGVLCILAKN